MAGIRQRSPSPQLAAATEAARRLLVAAGVLSLFVNLLMLTGPLYMLQVYDRVLGSRSYETLAVITLLTLALFVGMAVLDFARGALLSRSAAEIGCGSRRQDRCSLTSLRAMERPRSCRLNLRCAVRELVGCGTNRTFTWSAIANAV